MIQADDHDAAELAQVLAVIGIGFHRGAVREPAAMHPDHDRLLHLRAEALRPDVQDLAAVVLQPVAMRKDEFVDAGRGHLRDRAHGSPRLSALDAVPRLHGLRLLEAVSLGIGDAEEGVGLAVPEAAELSAFHIDDRGAQVGSVRRPCTRGGRLRISRAGFRLLLRKGVSGLQRESGQRAAHHGCASAQQRPAIHLVRRCA